jgi:hypothetical protein
MTDARLIEIHALPSVSMAELASLPPCGGIYVIVNEAHEVLYIGQSANIAARWRSHHVHRAVCDPDNAEESGRFRVYWLEMPDEAERLAVEVDLIRRFGPKLNNKHNGAHVHIPLANPLSEKERDELKMLIKATGLTMAELAKELDIDHSSLVGYCTGTKRPRHPAMVRKALQMCILEQRGVVTAKLVERMEVKE